MFHQVSSSISNDDIDFMDFPRNKDHPAIGYPHDHGDLQTGTSLDQSQSSIAITWELHYRPPPKRYTSDGPEEQYSLI